MTSEDIIALTNAIRREHRGNDALLPACASLIGETLRSAPEEEVRKMALGSMVALMWASSAPEQALRDLVQVNHGSGAPEADPADATGRLIGMLGDLYHGLLLNEVDGGDEADATPVLNAWLSVHLEMTVAAYGAEKAAAFLREAADGLAGAVDTRDAIRAMDERATHKAGRA